MERSRCRFGYPHPISATTRIRDLSDKLRVRGDRDIVLKRRQQDVWINNYNRPILKLWRSNIDVQPISNPHAVINYILSYITKDEKSEFLKICEDLEKHPDADMHKQLFIMSNSLRKKILIFL